MSLKTERRRFDAAADACEVDLSEWIRITLMAECDRIRIPIPEPEPEVLKTKKAVTKR